MPGSGMLITSTVMATTLITNDWLTSLCHRYPRQYQWGVVSFTPSFISSSSGVSTNSSSVSSARGRALHTRNTTHWWERESDHFLRTFPVIQETSLTNTLRRPYHSQRTNSWLTVIIFFGLRETSPCLNHDQWQDKKGQAPESQLTKSLANSQILLKSILVSDCYKRAEEQKSRLYKLVAAKKFQVIAINLSIKQILPSKDLSTRS